MYFVTGATGFLGRPLVDRLLEAGCLVRCLRRPRSDEAVRAGVQVVDADLLDTEALADGLRGCDTVVHLAGKAHDLSPADPSQFHVVNVEGTAALLVAAERARIRTFVYISSVKAMREGGDACLDENAAPEPTSPYGISKLEAERLVLDVGSRSAMRTTVIRLPLVYGPRMKGNLRAMFDAVGRGTFPPPPHVRNRRSLASTEDVATAVLLAAADPAAAGRTYLVTDGMVYSTRDIYDAMRAALGLPRIFWAVPLWAFRGSAAAGDALSRATGRRMPFSRLELEKLLGSACYIDTRIRRELGFTSATTLHDLLLRIGPAGVSR